MQHLLRRCKHCNKEYTYCTYGNGSTWGTEEHCSMDYCGECQTAINNALSNIPKKISYQMELIPHEDFNKINKIIDEEKEKRLKESKTMCMCMEMVKNQNYKNIEGCYIDHVYYIRGVKENNEIEIKQSMEYDLINKCLTGKKYYDYDKPRNQYKHLYQLPAINIEYLTKNNLPKPEGKINFFIEDYEWEVILPNNENYNYE